VAMFYYIYMHSNLFFPMYLHKINLVSKMENSENM